MSYVEKAYDRTPFIPGAGLPSQTSLEGASVAQSLQPSKYISNTNSTPDNIKKYRNSYHEMVGVKQLHYGIYDDNKDYENMVHGIKTQSSLHVSDCINGPNYNGNKNFMNDLAESQYASAKREPLGKSIVRNYKFPEICKSSDFKFGIPTTGISNAKDIIYNGSPEEENDYVKKLYYKSHGITGPGEHNTRYYNWNFDPQNHKFGLYKKIENDGVFKSLRNDFLLNPYPQTKLVEKRSEDFRIANNDILGKGKYHGSMNPKYFDENHIFGQKSKLGDAWNVGRCIHGDENTIKLKYLLPDEDLGKSTNFNKRIKNYKSQSMDNNIEYNKIYGVPSIRRDLQKPKKGRSVCDFKNYGDEPDAYDLLYPHPGAIRGVYDEDFEKLLTKEEIYNTMRKYDFIIPEEEYDLMFDICLKNYPNEEKKVSAKAFISTMRNLKREYQKYRIVN